MKAERLTAEAAGGTAASRLAVPAVLFLLALAGLGISSYLTYAHWADAPIACGAIEGCNEVNTSDYSEMAGIPVALLGALFYVALGTAALAWLLWHPQSLAWPMIGFWGLALGGTVYSAYLTYTELFVIDAVCIYCLASASITLASLLISSVVLVRESQPGED